MKSLRDEIRNEARDIRFRLGAADWHLLRIPAGQFQMGTPPHEPGRESWELAPRPVRITKPFYMAKYEATNAQYRAIMGPQRHAVPGDELLAYGEARFSDALEFCRQLSTHLGETVTLPTEAQWEYACRAGTQTPYYAGGTEQALAESAWYEKNAGESPHPGCEKQANRFGLCDMLGNVAEPCIDYILAPEKLTDHDPVGQTGLEYGCARGGSYLDTAPHCRAGSRLRTEDRLAGLGIRLVIHP